MSRRRLCPACDLPYQKGERVLLIDGKKTRSSNVCQGCASNAVKLVYHEPKVRRTRARCEQADCTRVPNICREHAAAAVKFTTVVRDMFSGGQESE